MYSKTFHAINIQILSWVFVRSKLCRYLEIEQFTYQNTNMFYKVRSNLSRVSSYSRIVSHEVVRTHFPETCESPELLLRGAFNLLTCFTQPSMLHDIPICFFLCMCTYAFVSRVSRVIVFDLPPIDLLLPMPRWVTIIALRFFLVWPYRA